MPLFEILFFSPPRVWIPVFIIHPISNSLQDSLHPIFSGMGVLRPAAHLLIDIYIPTCICTGESPGQGTLSSSTTEPSWSPLLGPLTTWLTIWYSLCTLCLSCLCLPSIYWMFMVCQSYCWWKFINVLISSLYHPWTVGSIIRPIWKMRKLKCREVKWITWSPKWQG